MARNSNFGYTQFTSLSKRSSLERPLRTHDAIYDVHAAMQWSHLRGTLASSNIQYAFARADSLMFLLPDYTRRIISRAGNKKFTRKRRIYYHQHTFKRRNGLPSKQRAGGRRVWSITRCSLVLCTSGNWCSIVPRIIYTRNMESILHLENLQISTFSLFSSCFLRPILFKSRIFIKDENNSTKRTNK